MKQLKRRGFTLGDIPAIPSQENELNSWHEGLPVLLTGACKNSLPDHNNHLKQTETLVNALLEGIDCDDILDTSVYKERLEPKFQSLGSAFNEGDQQEIETVTFDVVENENLLAEDLWLKASWLSFHDDDVSLRFRFSFGIDLEEDVAADPYRQKLAAELADRIFPESSIITNNHELESKLKQLLDCDAIDYVERIIYFNGPNGGAYLHHDLERGHAGVVYAQLSGRTFWLALPKRILIDEIIRFSKVYPWPNSLTLEMRTQMNELIGDRALLSDQLDSFSNTGLIHLINETTEFVQFLIARKHGIELNPGDTLLLPQTNKEICCWHSVFCIGEEMGQALSFAVRASS